MDKMKKIKIGLPSGNFIELYEAKIKGELWDVMGEFLKVLAIALVEMGFCALLVMMASFLPSFAIPFWAILTVVLLFGSFLLLLDRFFF